MSYVPRALYRQRGGLRREAWFDVILHSPSLSVPYYPNGLRYALSRERGGQGCSQMTWWTQGPCYFHDSYEPCRGQNNVVYHTLIYVFPVGYEVWAMTKGPVGW